MMNGFVVLHLFGSVERTQITEFRWGRGVLVLDGDKVGICGGGRV